MLDDYGEIKILLHMCATWNLKKKCTTGYAKTLLTYKMFKT